MENNSSFTPEAQKAFQNVSSGATSVDTYNNNVNSTAAINNNTPITSATLAPVTKTTLPKTSTVPTYGGLQGATESLVQATKTAQDKLIADQQKVKDTAGSDLTKSISELMGVNTEIGNVSSNVDRTAQDAAQKQVDNYNKQLESEQLALRRSIETLQKNSAGGTERSLALQEQELTRKSLSAQADIGLLLSASNRDLATAANIADRQVQNNLEKLTAKSNNLKLFIDLNKDAFDKADARLYDQASKKVDAELKKQTDNENAIRDIKLEAVKNGAGLSVLNSLSAIDTTNPKAFDQAIKATNGYLGKNEVVKLDNGNTVMINGQGKVISNLGGAKANTDNNYVITSNNLKNSSDNNVVGIIANVIKNSGAKQSQSTNDAINVISGLQQLVKDNPTGEFVGLNPLIRLPGKLSSPESLTNRSDIEAINLKVQQWASGAALTEAQTKQVEKITPKKSDTDKQIKAKVNALANYMVSQVSGQLAGQGVSFVMEPIDYFQPSAEDRLATSYKDPQKKLLIEQTIKQYPNATADEILQIIE